MSLKPSSLIAVLTLGTSLMALGAGSAASLAAENAAVRFGAPALPVDSGAGGGHPVALATVQKPAAASWLPDKPKPQDPAASGTGSTGASEPNLSALRFYAGQNDLARVAAEIRLLRARFPGWEPPADLFLDNQASVAEQPLWDLFAKHDLAGLKAAIAERQEQTPGWQPSADLTGKLAIAEAYDALVLASDKKDYPAVVDVASANRGLMTCGTIDAVWRTAEALAQTGDEPHAMDAYRFILATCPLPQERLATVQKASVLIKSPEAIDSLVRMGKRLPDGTSEFADMRLDGVRQRIGDAAAGRTTTAPSQGDIDQIAARAHTAGGSKDAELLGWYALSRKDYPGAETWFRTAMQPTPTSKAAEGLVLTLRDGGKIAEAATLAPRYAALGSLNRKLMMEVMVANLVDAKQAPTAEDLAALGAAIDAEKSADAAQSLGWSRFKADDAGAAKGWFAKSLAWQPNEAAAIGLMLASRRLKDSAAYGAVVEQYRASYPRVADLDKAMKGSGRPARQARQGTRGQHVASRGGRATSHDAWDQSASAIVQTYEGGHVDQALAMMDARRATRAEPAGLSIVRGWALYKKGDWDGAKQVFNEAENRGMADEASRGLKQIELGYTNPRFR